ncbi:MAG: 4'-phosphopantetheinyl transferase superfamily protein [Lachnospiraceae bacterium]|nr:4'-phosphopantetheinyl transferase superfamily protein [Lachnospiraceae bacterium]
MERLKTVSAGVRRMEIEAGGYLLGKALMDEYGLSDNDVRSLKVAYKEHGKPYLPDYSSIHYNISHSEDLVVLATSNEEIGVDVLYRSRKVVDNLASRVLFPGNSCEEAMPVIEVFSIKEAYVKLTGSGIGFGFDKIKLDSDNRVYIVDGRAAAHYDLMDIDKNYIVCVAGY